MARNPLDIYKFIQAATSLAKRGVKETDILNAAKREFGEVSDLLKIQVRKIFKNKDAPSIKNPNKDADIVPINKNQDSGIMERIGKASSRIEELMKEQQSMYKPKQGLQLVEGLTRTITRKILDRKNIEIPKGSDPIKVFSDTFGESIGDVSNLAEELIEIDRRGGASGSIDDMIEKDGLFNIEIPKNPQRGLTDEEFKQLKKEVDQEKMLDGFDPTDRTENSMGGINRINLRSGTKVIKLAKFFKDKGTTLAAEIRKAVDNIFASGDSKYDADVAVDSALEEFGVDREMFDQMDIIDAYDEAYQTIVTQRGLASGKIPGGTQVFKDSKGDVKGITMGGDKEFKKAMSEAMEEGMRESENMKRLGLDPTKMDDALKYDEMKEAGQLEKNVTEEVDLSQGMIDLDELNFTSNAEAAKKTIDSMSDADLIMKKYPGMTRELAEQIANDPNPERKAQVIAMVEQTMELDKQGKSGDEIIDIFKKGTDRTKQANGGLSYLMGM